MTYSDLIAAGWTVDAVSLYDEEGVEGWRWTDPAGEQYDEIGAWCEPPPIPGHMADAGPPARDDD